MESTKTAEHKLVVNKYQEALDVFIEYVNYLSKNKMLSEEQLIGLYEKLYSLQELVDRATQPNDFDEAMKFHRTALQEHLGAIARLQEICSENEFGSKNYILSKEIIEEYLNTECECAVEQVIEDLHSYLDWSKDE